MISNSTLKVPTHAFMPNNAFTSTTSWIWGCMLLIALLFSGVAVGQEKNQPSKSLRTEATSQEKNSFEKQTLTNDKKENNISRVRVNDTQVLEGPKLPENQSPLDAVKGKKEDISKRDYTSKHFTNDDGTYTALIGAGPIHYKKDDAFLEIDHKIISINNSDYPYANTTNLFESHFGATANVGVKNITKEGVVKEFINTQMYWEVNGQQQLLKEATNSPITIEGDKAFYNNIFGNINAEFTILAGKRKLNYIIPNSQVLENIPDGANYLVFSEDIQLPNGWTHTVDKKKGVSIKNSSGKVVYTYKNPQVFENYQGDLTIPDKSNSASFELKKIGNTLTILLKVKTQWLQNENRIFPLAIDPTVQVTPDDDTYWSGWVDEAGNGGDDIMYVGNFFGDENNAFIRFNLSTIPVGSDVTAVTSSLYRYFGVGSTAASRQMSIAGCDVDPIPALFWIDIWNGFTGNISTAPVSANNSNDYKTNTFNVAGVTQVENALVDGFTTILAYPVGTWGGFTNYAGFYGYSSANNVKPYLSITYTEPCKIWDGSVNSDWFEDNNWTPAGAPSATDCVIIPDVTPNSFPELSGGGPPIPPIGYAGSVLVEAGATLEIPSTRYLVITNELTNAGGTVIIRSGGSLVQVNDVVNTGDIIMERQVSGITNLNYVYWSSAVDDFNVSEIAPTGNTNLMFEWNPIGAGDYGIWENYTGVMEEGKGYIVRGLQGTAIAETASFLGVPRNGTINVPISRGTNTTGGAGAGSTPYTAIDDNWNLVGNPYPSAISANDFITANAGVIADDTDPLIAGTIYLWDSTGLPSGGSGEDPFYGDYVYNYQGANYISYNITGPNPSGYGGDIAAGQAFFVLMEDAGLTTQNITFDNTMRGVNVLNDEFMRQSQSSTSIERHRIWLDIINSNNKATSLLIGYIEGATNGMDRLYDGIEMNDTGLKFYSFAEDIKLSISGKALPFDVSETIPLGFEVASNGTFTIAINNLDGLFETTNQAIYLEDMLTNTIHDLKANPYVFTTVSGTHNDRFLLRFTSETLGINDPEFNSGLNIISYSNEIKVTSTNNPINSIEVYDILGRTIATYKDVNVTEFKFNLTNVSNGTFIVKATLYNGQQKVKKVVN